MRYSTGMKVTRKIPPKLSINIPPNPEFPPEIHVDFGGMSMWFTEEEATRFGKQLIEAGMRVRKEVNRGEATEPTG